MTAGTAPSRSDERAVRFVLCGRCHGFKDGLIRMRGMSQRSVALPSSAAESAKDPGHDRQAGTATESIKTNGRPELLRDARQGL